MYETDVGRCICGIHMFKMSEADNTSRKLITTSGINQTFIIYYTYSATDNNIKLIKCGELYYYNESYI